VAEPTAVQKIHDALSQRGFRPDWTQPRRAYAGLLDSGGLSLPAIVEVTDVDFVKPPKIRIDSANYRGPTLVPHVLSDDLSICYFEPGGVVLDRYNPGGTILQCLDQAETVVRDAIRGRLSRDFAEEFSAYWGEHWAMVDLADGFVGSTTERRLALRSPKPDTIAICQKDSWLCRLHGKNTKAPPACEGAEFVKIAGPLSPIPGLPWPPKTLSQLNNWLGSIDASVVGKLEQAFVGSEGFAHWLGVVATNGTCLARAVIPESYRKPEFLESRRHRLPDLLGFIADKVAIERYNGYRADSAYIFGRNMGGQGNLSGKHILLVGCGTIGGFLAQLLAQSGAGVDGGKLVLVDQDTLRTANLGRHLLGVPYLDVNKAEGCRDYLLQQLPMLRVEAEAGDVLTMSTNFGRFDLIIDATGEEALSIALNDRIVRMRPQAPPVLFVWLLGNGAAAQSLLTGEAEWACFKCLKPELAGPGRFRTLRDDVEVVVERNLSCSDPLYVPFPVTRSVSAAALACQHALDWANGSMTHRFCSRTLDARRAHTVKDANPASVKECPACGRAE
jgi:molybdopterin/thiamine biosynthesis adenylyltransferase